jgi:hypothetical protein
LVESVKARQNYVFLFDFVAFLTNRTLLVLLAEVLLVCLSKLACWQGIQKLLRHWLNYVFVQLEELFVLFWIVFILFLFKVVYFFFGREIWGLIIATADMNREGYVISGWCTEALRTPICLITS